MQAKILIIAISTLLALGLSDCSQKRSEPFLEETTTLLDTYWKLLELEGQPVTTTENAQEAHIILAAGDESRAHGFSSCNNFFGNYKINDESLSFSAMGSTLMACPEGMDTEQVFFDVLAKTTRYRISGQFLQIYAGDQPLARFEAVKLEKPANG